MLRKLFHDHLPAKQAGLPTVWINRRHEPPRLGGDASTPGRRHPGCGVPLNGRVRRGRRSRVTGSRQRAGHDATDEFRTDSPSNDGSILKGLVTGGWLSATLTSSRERACHR